MKLNCPSCSESVDPKDVNVQTDVAYCRTCESAFSISKQVSPESASEAISVDTVSDPPAGAWFREGMEGEVFGATTRSGAAFFLVPFMLVWSGGSLGGIYGSQLMKGEFELTISLFGIPFLIGSIVLGSLALMSIWGKVEISMRGSKGKIVTGVGGIGWKRDFDLKEVSRINDELSNMTTNGQRNRCIVLEGKRRLKFGSSLSEDRRYFILHTLRYLNLKYS